MSVVEYDQVPVMQMVADASVKKKKVYTMTMSANGQVTIPKELREDLDLRPGDTVIFIPKQDGFSIHKRKSLREEISEWREGLSPETKEMIKMMAGWTLNQYHEYFDNLPDNITEVEREYDLKKED